MSGPYESERDAVDEPMPREVAALARTSGPGRLARNIKLAALISAANGTGAGLGEFDRQILRWLADWEPETVQVIVGLIVRAHQAGVEQGRAG